MSSDIADGQDGRIDLFFYTRMENVNGFALNALLGGNGSLVAIPPSRSNCNYVQWNYL